MIERLVMRIPGAVEEPPTRDELCEHGADDERRPDVLRRERQEQRTHKVMADLRGSHRNAVYRRLALKSDLPDGVKVTLCQLLEYAGQLANCFPSLATIAKRFGGPLPSGAKERRAELKRRVAVLKKRIRIAVDRHWLARIPLTRDEDGTLEEVEHGKGRFTSAWGNQFNVPPNVIGPNHPGVPGPQTWSNRIYAGRKRRAQ